MDYAAYQCRYAAVPPNGEGNLWYSYDFGAAHYVNIDSEEDQSPTSPQAQWLAADLARAAANRAAIPWIIMLQHRPVYSSTKSESGSHLPGGGFAAVLEPYLKQYKVDLFLTGHQHQCAWLPVLPRTAAAAAACARARARARPLTRPPHPTHPTRSRTHARTLQTSACTP